MIFKDNKERDFYTLDLAYIIHGVVIAEGFLNIAKVKCIQDLLILIFMLAISIFDWHIFYEIDNFLTSRKPHYYTWYLWFLDYAILANYAIFFESFTLLRSNKAFLIRFSAVSIAVLYSVWWFIIFHKLRERRNIPAKELIKMFVFNFVIIIAIFIKTYYWILIFLALESAFFCFYNKKYQMFIVSKLLIFRFLCKINIIKDTKATNAYLQLF